MRGKNCWHRHLVNFLSFWVTFALLPPSPTNNGDVIILHVRNKNHNHDVSFLRYGAWQTYFFIILGHFFCSFDPPNLKNQNFEKWKKCLGILSFCTWVPQMMIIWYMVSEIWNKKDRIFCHFGLFFALLPANNSENNNFEKKKSLEILSFYVCVP